MSQVIFVDDFSTLDLSRWNTRWHYTQKTDPGCSLPSNGELELYVNVDGPLKATPWTVKDSVLSLTATPDPTYKYLSGMLNTFGTFSQTYGYFEIRAKLPKGNGMWPAFWLLPADGTWPPELDILEALGRDPNTIYMSTHSAVGGPNVGSGGIAQISNPQEYHIYGTDWQADKVTWYIDGVPVLSKPTPPDMNKPMYIVLNLAVGGSWAGAPDATTVFPASFDIDYVKVWDKYPGDLQHVVANPWSSVVLPTVKAGENVTLGFDFDEISILHDDAGSAIWVRTGKTWTCAAIVPGKVKTFGF